MDQAASATRAFRATCAIWRAISAARPSGMGERGSRNEQVVGSIPTGGAINAGCARIFVYVFESGSIPWNESWNEWPAHVLSRGRHAVTVSEYRRPLPSALRLCASGLWGADGGGESPDGPVGAATLAVRRIAAAGTAHPGRGDVVIGGHTVGVSRPQPADDPGGPRRCPRPAGRGATAEQEAGQAGQRSGQPRASKTARGSR